MDGKIQVQEEWSLWAYETVFIKIYKQGIRVGGV